LASAGNFDRDLQRRHRMATALTTATFTGVSSHSRHHRHMTAAPSLRLCRMSPSRRRRQSGDFGPHRRSVERPLRPQRPGHLDDAHAAGNIEPAGLSVAFGLGAGTSTALLARHRLGNGTYTAFSRCPHRHAADHRRHHRRQCHHLRAPHILVVSGNVSLSQSTLTMRSRSIQSGSTATITLTTRIPTATWRLAAARLSLSAWRRHLQRNLEWLPGQRQRTYTESSPGRCRHATHHHGDHQRQTS